MMLSIATALTGIITLYSGPKAPDARIEAVTDRGPILEMIVRCPKGTGIMSYSKLERLFCDPRLRCDPEKEVVMRRTCG